MKGEKPAAGDQEYQIHFRHVDIPSKKTVEYEGKTALAAKSVQHGTDLINAITYAQEGQMQGDIFQASRRINCGLSLRNCLGKTTTR